MKLLKTVALTLIALAGLAAPWATAQTIVVDITDDVSDFAPPYQVAQLPGPDGHISFGEAIEAANNTPGPQTIEFRIPKSQWWLLDDVALLRQEHLFLLTGDDTTIDFSTQTAFTGDTNPNGNEVGIYGVEPNAWGIASIWIMGNRCTVKGLGYVWQRGCAVQLQGNDNRVIGCVTDGGLGAAVVITGGFGGPSPHGNIIGGTEPGEGNWLTAGGGGVSIVGPADHNIVIGNTLTGPSSGIEVIGSVQYNMIAADNRIGGPTPAERNIISGAGKYGEEGMPGGTQVRIEDADRTIIEGNYIGTNADGTGRPAKQIGPGGIGILRSRGTVIRNNLISGLRTPGINHYQGSVFGEAIGIAGNTVDTVIQGNLIGTDYTGTQPIATLSGISFDFWPGEKPPANTLIGGQEPGQANTIAYTDTAGILIFYNTFGATISANSIHDNGTLGIDLLTVNGGGVSPNDSLDADTGGNRLQNFPVLAAATFNGQVTTITGDLDSTPNRTFTVEFFSSPACGPLGYGQGAVFLGSAVVNTDGAGHAEVNAQVSGAAPGDAITATATDQSTGDTSEFSACIPAEGGHACYADFTADGVLDLFDFLAYVNAFNAGNPDADCDHDANLTLFDFLCFVNAFNAGC